MRLMSFSLTTEQVRRREKTVTRRLGWKFLQPGEHLRAVVKAMGLKKGQHPEQLALIEVVSVRREPLGLITPADVVREGFPEATPRQFVEMFCRHYGKWVTGLTEVTRIEFRYLKERP